MIAAVQRREIVPVGAELRALAWIGVTLIATGLGIFIKNHFDAIGPLTIAIVIGVLAVACFVWVQLKARAPLDDYVVLLGALIVSADVAFIETQWHLLGNEWQRHFLLLALIHAALAYWFDSRAVLSLSVAALATWFGIERYSYFSDSAEMGLRAFACAAAVGMWRAANRHEPFDAVLDQFAVNLAFWGGLVLTTNGDSRYLGLILTLLIAAVVLRLGFRRKREIFVMYAFIYTIIVINIVAHAPFLIMMSAIAGIGALFVIHALFEKHVANV